MFDAQNPVKLRQNYVTAIFLCLLHVQEFKEPKTLSLSLSLSLWKSIRGDHLNSTVQNLAQLDNSSQGIVVKEIGL